MFLVVTSIRSEHFLITYSNDPIFAGHVSLVVYIVQLSFKPDQTRFIPVPPGFKPGLPVLYQPNLVFNQVDKVLHTVIRSPQFQIDPVLNRVSPFTRSSQFQTTLEPVLNQADPFLNLAVYQAGPN